MGFLIYEKSHVGDRVQYSKRGSLKLGGRDGLIARHTRTLAEPEARSWKLDVEGLLRLAGHESGKATGQGTLTVLFDVAGRESTSACLYELLKIHGSCRDLSTQLALDFAVVLDQALEEDSESPTDRFEVLPPLKPKLLGETLSLTGGPGGGDWKWGAPPLQLGAAIVQPGHAHGGGEPCANCTCGRRPASG